MSDLLGRLADAACQYGDARKHYADTGEGLLAVFNTEGAVLRAAEAFADDWRAASDVTPVADTG